MKANLEDVMKPTIITCGKCDGKLFVIPRKEELGKGKFKFYTLMACSNCGISEGK